MILRTLALATTAYGLATTSTRPRTTALKAEKPAWADAVKDEAVAEDVVADSPSLFDFFGGASVNSEAAKALKEEMRRMAQTVDAAVADAQKAQREYAKAVANAERAEKAAVQREERAIKATNAAKEAASQLRGPPPAAELERAKVEGEAEAEEQIAACKAREAAAFERTAKLIEQREADVKKASEENRALLAAAETEKNRAERAQRAAEQRRDAAIKQANTIADSSVKRAEAEVQRLQNEASGTATKIDPTAAAVAGGLCGLLLCNSVGLAQLDLLGAGAGAAAMFAALDSMGSAAEKEKVEAK